MILDAWRRMGQYHAAEHCFMHSEREMSSKNCQRNAGPSVKSANDDLKKQYAHTN